MFDGGVAVYVLDVDDPGAFPPHAVGGVAESHW